MRIGNRSEHHVKPPDIPSYLAEAIIGDEVLVENILSPTVRATCRDSGISVGHRLRVEGRRRNQVLVRNGVDPPVWLSDLFAYFIVVWKLRGGQRPGRGDRPIGVGLHTLDRDRRRPAERSLVTKAYPQPLRPVPGDQSHSSEICRDEAMERSRLSEIRRDE